jgi:hypothetical protein
MSAERSRPSLELPEKKTPASEAGQPSPAVPEPQVEPQPHKEALDQFMREIYGWEAPEQAIPESFVFGPSFPVSARSSRRTKKSTDTEKA